MVWRAWTEQEQAAFWSRYRAGSSLRSIGQALGHSMQTLRTLMKATGGRQPVVPRRSARCLSLGEREEISRGVVAGQSCRTIAGRIGRAPSTVSREIAHNGGLDGYRACQADRAAWDRARRPKPAKLATRPALRELVEAKLALRWSPQQIAGWLTRAYPGDRERWVSHETIYLSLFVQSRGALRKELTRYLRTRRMVRRPHAGQAITGQGQLRDAVNISARPAEVADRAVPGHWEGDLLLGGKNSAIATLVERTSRLTLLVGLPDGRSSEPVLAALAGCIATLPEHWRDRSVIRAALGSAARTRTPTVCSASTTRRAPTSPLSVRTSSTQSPQSSTVALDKPSAGCHLRRSSPRPLRWPRETAPDSRCSDRI